jgi:hypothetical protein
MAGNAFWTQLLDLVEFTDYIATFADPARQIVDIEPYSYSIDGDAPPGFILQNQPIPFVTPMAGDADFVMIATSAFGRTGGSTLMLVNAAILVQIVDQSSGRAFFNQPTPLPFIAGQGGFPYLLPGPRVIKARSSLLTTANSAQINTFTGFYMTFHGARIWYGN